MSWTVDFELPWADPQETMATACCQSQTSWHLCLRCLTFHVTQKVQNQAHGSSADHWLSSANGRRLHSWGGWLFRFLPLLLSQDPLCLRRSRSSFGMAMLTLIKCKLGSSMVTSGTTGNWMNSIGKASGSPSRETASAVMVTAVLAALLAGAFRRSGHSARQ